MPKLSKITEYTFSEFIQENYVLGSKKKFSKKEKEKLRPIAEVFALLDGNAFFGISIDDNGEDIWYEQYLPQAYAVFKANGGDKGWASQLSWLRDIHHENASVREAYEHWQLLKILAKNKN